MEHGNSKHRADRYTDIQIAKKRRCVMANEQNLIPGAHKLSVEEASKGGIASGKARAEKRDLRKALEMLLEQTFTDKKGNTKTGTQAVTERLFAEVMKGNVKAFEVLRDTVGQKPVEKVMVAEVEQSVIDEVEKAVLGDG